MNRVLVVDDDRLVAETIGIIFRKHGFDVRTAYSAKDALCSAHEFGPDLLLCDIDMPERDGVELMGDVEVALPACRILVLTGSYSSLPRVRDRSIQMPRPVGILTKPCQPTDLLREAGAMLRTA